MAELLYADANGDKLPEGGKWMDLSVPFLAPSAKDIPYHCPFVEPSACGYAMSSALAGKSYKKLQDPEKSFLLFETAETKKDVVASVKDGLSKSRHGNRNVIVGFADSSVKSMQQGMLAPEDHLGFEDWPLRGLSPRCIYESLGGRNRIPPGFPLGKGIISGGLPSSFPAFLPSIIESVRLQRSRQTMDQNYHLDFLRVTEAAALASARWVGKGDRTNADQAACEGMRGALNELDMCGTICIGEGERDEAPMLFIGEKVGTGEGPKIQIAVDPLEGTNLCANGTPNAIAVLAAAIEGHGKLMHAPDCYMEKLVVGAECVGCVDITLPPRVNVRLMAKALGKDVDELIIGVLDRPRHETLIQEIRDAGARVHLVPDGDLSVAIAALDPDAGVDGLMGIGGAPEGVITAAAVLCNGGEMQARLKFTDDKQRERAEKMVDGDIDRVLFTSDLASGSVMFSATGITSGDLLKGVRYRRGYASTDSIVMRSANGTIRRIETVHLDVNRKTLFG